MKTKTKKRLTALAIVTLMITLLISNVTMAVDADDSTSENSVEVASYQEDALDELILTPLEEWTEEAESGYIGIMPFITIPPYVAVLFMDYATGRPLFDQVHVPTIGVLPNVSVTITEFLPEGWQVHHWYINYYIMGMSHSIYRYETVLEGDILLHILPNYEEITPGAWLMLPTFIVHSGPIPPLLTGTVTCDLTGRPIPGVTVNLYDEDGNVIDTQITDEDGFFDFGEVPIGDLEVGIDHDTIPDGYEILPCSRDNRPITTSPGGVYEEHFFIQPIRPPTITKAATHVNGEAYTGQYVDVGDVITYVLTVNNPNFTTLNDHLVRDILPDGIALDVDSVSVHLASSLVEDLSHENTVEVVLNLPSGNTTITFDATVTVEAFDNIINIAFIYGPPGEGDYQWCEEEDYIYVPGDREEVDDDTENIPVEELELPTLTKEATHLNGAPYNGEPVDVGDVVTYVLTVNNPNLRSLNNHLVRDILPTSLSLAVDSVEVYLPSSLVEDLSDGNTVEVILNLPPGDTTITFDATVTIDAFDEIINIARIYGPPSVGEYEWCEEEEDYVYLPGDREEVDDDTETIPVVDLEPPTLSKEATHVDGVPYAGDPVDVGDVVTYVLTVNNPNLRPLGNFLVRDELPIALALNVDSVAVHLPSSLVEDLSADNTVEVILNLPPGNTTITFTAVVTEYAYENIINVATLYGPPEEGDYEWCEEEEDYVYLPGDREEVDDDTVTIPVVEMDMPTLTKEATYVDDVPYDGQSVFIGDVITYVLTVNNPNLRPLENFLVRDELPACLALNVDSVVVYLASSLVEDLSADNTIEAILNLPPGDTTITFTAVVTEEAQGNIVNVAYLYGPPEEGDYEWCEEEEEYVYLPGDREEVDDDNETIPVAEIGPPTITKEATHVGNAPFDGDPVAVGDVITYVLTVNNPNLRPLEDFLVRDELPAGLALNRNSVVVHPESSLVENLSAGNTVEVILNLPPGNTTITFTAVVTEEAEDYIVNMATLYSPPEDGDYEWCEEEEDYVYVPGDREEIDYDDEVVNLEEEEEEAVRQPGPPTITKTASYQGNRVQVGNTITYRLTVHNPNDTVLENHLVRDALPTGLNLHVNSVTVSPASAVVGDIETANNTVSVVLNLPPGDTTITFTATVTATAPDRIINIGYLYGPQESDGQRPPVDDDRVTVEIVRVVPAPDTTPGRQIPKTGDQANMMLWLALFAIGLVGLSLTSYKAVLYENRKVKSHMIIIEDEYDNEWHILRSD